MGEEIKVLFDTNKTEHNSVKGSDSNNPPKATVKPRGAEEEKRAPFYIPHFTDTVASLRVLAEALRRSDYLTTCADNSHKKTFTPPEYSRQPLGDIFLSSDKSMRAHNELLSALNTDFHADQFIADLYKLDYRQLCGCLVPAVHGLQAKVSRYLGNERKKYSNLIEHIEKTEPYSKEKTQKISSMIKFSEEIKGSSYAIMADYDGDWEDTYEIEDDNGTWTVGGCAHAAILAGLLRHPNASKNVLASEFIDHNREAIRASYVQFSAIKAFRALAGDDLPRWYRLLSLVGYGAETVLRGDLIGLPFGMVRIEKRKHTRKDSTWYQAPVTPDDLFQASCLICGKPLPRAVKWDDLQSGRFFSHGCAARSTMYPEAVERLRASAIKRFKAKKSECANGEKNFCFDSPDDFLESVGLPWGAECFDLSRWKDHRYSNVPYAPGYTYWECPGINRARGGKVTYRKRIKLPVECDEPKMPYSLSDIGPYSFAPGAEDKATLETLRNNVWVVKGTKAGKLKTK